MKLSKVSTFFQKRSQKLPFLSSVSRETGEKKKRNQFPVKTDPFLMKLTRFYETGLLFFPVSFWKFTYFLCKNTSFWPVFVKKWGFIFFSWPNLDGFIISVSFMYETTASFIFWAKKQKKSQHFPSVSRETGHKKKKKWGLYLKLATKKIKKLGF